MIPDDKLKRMTDALDRANAALARDFLDVEATLARIGLDLEGRGFEPAPTIVPIDALLRQSKGARARRHIVNALTEVRSARRLLTKGSPP